MPQYLSVNSPPYFSRVPGINVATNIRKSKEYFVKKNFTIFVFDHYGFDDYHSYSDENDYS